MDLFAPHPASLRQLQYLVAVVETGGFRKAADACHVSQPSLSAQVAQVERAFGVQIFERTGRGVRLTAAGDAVIARARQVLLASRDLQDAARAHADPFEATMRIGIIPTVCPYLLPEVTPSLSRRFPKLTIVWTEDRTARLVAEVRGGALDAAIVALESDLADLAHRVLTRDAFVLAAAPAHPLMRTTKPTRIQDLAGTRMLLLEDGHCLRDQAKALCQQASAPESPGYQATSLSTLVQMVGAATSKDATLLPAMALAVENRRGQLATRKFASPAPGRTIVIAWRRGSPAERALQSVAKVLRAAG